MCQTKSVSKSRGGWWADCWRGEGEHKPAYPYMQREEVSRREGRGHTGFLYSHRYRRDFYCSLAKDGRKRGGKKTEREHEHHISVMLSQHVHGMCAFIELEIFRGHVLICRKLSSSKGSCDRAVSRATREESSPGLYLKGSHPDRSKLPH